MNFAIRNAACNNAVQFEASTPHEFRVRASVILADLPWPGAGFLIVTDGHEWLNVPIKFPEVGYVWLRATWLKPHLLTAESAAVLFANARRALAQLAQFEHGLNGLSKFVAAPE